jgi:hypothetical protein
MTITENVGRGKTRVGGRLIAFFTVSIASADEVGADVSSLEPGAVDRRQCNFPFHHPMLGGHLDCFVELPLRMSRNEQPSRRLLKCTDVGNLL